MNILYVIKSVAPHAVIHAVYITVSESFHSLTIIKDTSKKKEKEKEWETQQKADKEKRYAKKRQRRWGKDEMQINHHPQNPSLPKVSDDNIEKLHRNKCKETDLIIPNGILGTYPFSVYFPL